MSRSKISYTRDKIIIEDIFGSNDITINTPIIFLHNVSKEYLIPTDTYSKNNIYNVNIDKLYNKLEYKIEFLDRYSPVGQIKATWTADKQLYTIPMANTRIFQVTNSYKNIGNNNWIGIIKKGNQVSRTLGTIYSETTPNIAYPIFPTSYLTKLDTDNYMTNAEFVNYSDIFSDERYGKWILNTYKFNVDKSHIKMIDTMGDISNMYIPKSVKRDVTPKDVLDIGYGDDKYDRKIFFSAQGDIENNANCNPPLDNSGRMSINECNGQSFNMNYITAHDDDQLSSSLDNANYDKFYDSHQQTRSKNNLNKKTNRKSRSQKIERITGQKPSHINQYEKSNKIMDCSDNSNDSLELEEGHNLVLREKDEPWFENTDIVGHLANVEKPYMVYKDGHNDNKINRLIMPLDGTPDRMIDNENQKDYISNCIGSDPAPGYSRYEKDKNCKNNNGEYSNSKSNDSSLIEQFDPFKYSPDKSTEYVNNTILYALCIILIMLIIYKKTIL